MREYFENEICANCCIDKQFCDRCGVRKKTANSEKEKPTLMDRLYESDRNCDGNCKNCVAICGMTQNTIFLEAADVIEELLAVVPHWISVEERLPQKYKNVITVDKHGHVQWNYLINGKHITWSNGYHITHWMPLPKPPKEGKQP